MVFDHGLGVPGNNRFDDRKGLGFRVLPKGFLKPNLSGCLTKKPKTTVHGVLFNRTRINHDHLRARRQSTLEAHPIAIKRMKRVLAAA
jgi:hypothetical protein